MTLNLRDFPVRDLARLGLRIWHPDALYCELHTRDAAAMLAILRFQGAALRSPRALDATLHVLSRICPRFVEQVRAAETSR